jgi:hypothetical protein
MTVQGRARIAPIAMTTARPCEVPLGTLLLKYKDGAGFADCYCTEVAGSVSQAAFVEAFYTSALFRVERALLQWLASKPSTNAEARQLATGATSSFAAWRVEDRRADELLLADVSGRTRSWLMVAPLEPGSSAARTRLYFGSAIVPRRAAGSSPPRMGFAFHALLGFHKLYSRWLLQAASVRMRAGV